MIARANRRAAVRLAARSARRRRGSGPSAAERRSARSRRPAPRPARRRSCCAASVAISRASASPCSPVHAFALPALAITALARPAATLSRDTTTGAAQKAFLVKMPAATAGPIRCQDGKIELARPRRLDASVDGASRESGRRMSPHRRRLAETGSPIPPASSHIPRTGSASAQQRMEVQTPMLVTRGHARFESIGGATGEFQDQSSNCQAM